MGTIKEERKNKRNRERKGEDRKERKWINK